METWPNLIEKLDNGKYLFISFKDGSQFTISAELLRVECPSADVQGHGGPKIIVKNKNQVLSTGKSETKKKAEQMSNNELMEVFMLRSAEEKETLAREAKQAAPASSAENNSQGE